jgi:hypothetical protein
MTLAVDPYRGLVGFADPKKRGPAHTLAIGVFGRADLAKR